MMSCLNYIRRLCYVKSDHSTLFSHFNTGTARDGQLGITLLSDSICPAYAQQDVFCLLIARLFEPFSATTSALSGVALDHNDICSLSEHLSRN